MVRCRKREQMAAPVQDQAERLAEVLELNLAQPARVGGCDRDRAGVMLIGLTT
jgi:hypothetical protein